MGQVECREGRKLDFPGVANILEKRKQPIFIPVAGCVQASGGERLDGAPIQSSKCVLHLEYAMQCVLCVSTHLILIGMGNFILQTGKLRYRVANNLLKNYYKALIFIEKRKRNLVNRGFKYLLDGVLYTWDIILQIKV